MSTVSAVAALSGEIRRMDEELGALDRRKQEIARKRDALKTALEILGPNPRAEAPTVGRISTETAFNNRRNLRSGRTKNLVTIMQHNPAKHYTVADMVNESGLSRKVMHTTAGKLVRRGFIRRVAVGVYAAAR